MSDDPIFWLSLALPLILFAAFRWHVRCGKSGTERFQFLRKIVRTFLVIAISASIVFAACELYWNLTENLTLALFLFSPVLAVVLAVKFFRYNRHNPSQAGWLRLITGNVLILMVLLSICLPGFEIYYRFFCDTTDSISNTKISERWMQRHYHLNKAGFRDDVEYHPLIENGKRRVSFVGDSFTAGHGIKDIDRRFTNIIRKDHPEWEIQTIAHLGYDTGAELEMMQNEVKAGWQFDTVVLVYCLNDVSDITPQWQQSVARLSGRMSRRAKLFDQSYFLNVLYNRLVIARIPWIKDYYNVVKDAYHGEIWEKQQERLREFKKLVESRGANLMVVTFPFLHAIGPRYEYESVHRELEKFWQALDVPYLDLLPAFNGFKPRDVTVNAFDAHPNELANEIAAQKIEAFLSRQLAGKQKRSARQPESAATNANSISFLRR